MRQSWTIINWLVVTMMCVAAGAPNASAQQPITSSFTYQGRLTENGVPLNGTIDTQFVLYDGPDPFTDIALTAPLVANGVAVVDGRFTVDLDFGDVFHGEKRYLEVWVASPPGSGLTPLSPCQPISATPYALHTRGLFVDNNGTLVLGDESNRNGSLFIYGSSQFPKITLQADEVNTDGGAIEFRNDADTDYAQIWWSSQNGSLEIMCGDLAQRAWLTLRDNGMIGIGEPFPVYPLEVGTGTDVSVSGGGYFVVGNPYSSHIVMDDNEIMARDDDVVAPLYFNHEGGPVLIGAASNGATRVGINTGTPGAFTFAVNGLAAKPGGGMWSTFSDERLKRNIRSLDAGVLDRVLSLRGRAFEYTADAVERRLALPGRQVGFIAQEVEQVFPDWVDEDEDGMKVVTERGTTALVVEALRELRAEKDGQIRALETTVAQQQRQLETMSVALEQLQAMLVNRP